MPRWGCRAWVLAAMGAVALGCAVSAGAAVTVTQRISVTASGQQGNGESRAGAISADGRYVVFDSAASNLVAGDTNDAADVFELELATGAIERVDVSSAGVQAAGEAGFSAISADGRYVTFISYASNLVAGDDNGFADVFVHDRVTGITQLVDRSSGGQQAQGGDTPGGGAISADGRYVTFESSASNLVAGDTHRSQDVFVRDRSAGTTPRSSVSSEATQADGDSFSSSISADGQYIAFASFADNLVAGDSNGITDVFVRDRTAGTTTRASVRSDGGQAIGPGGASFGSESPVISADGRHVAFMSDATNLVAGDSNGLLDAFVHDLAGGATESVSVAADGSQANGDSQPDWISPDGGVVVIDSTASNLVASDTNHTGDVFVRDRTAGTTVRASAAPDGAQGNGPSLFGSVSGDGRLLVFTSYASNLVAGDTNGTADLFARDLTVALPPPPPSCGADVATIIGTPGDDILTGTPGRDVVLAGSGNDTIRTGAGDDVICAGNGDDVIDAGAGDDIVQGGFGSDRVTGGDGADQLFGRWGTDTLAGGAGDDLLKGGKGDDAIDGGDGFDTCRGGSGSDSATACERVRGVP